MVAQPTVLAINAGSASVKSALFTFEASPRPLQRAVAEPDASQVQDLLMVADRLADTRLTAIGHRIVHGGGPLSRAFKKRESSLALNPNRIALRTSSTLPRACSE